MVDAQEALGLGHPLLGDRHRLVLFVELVIEVGHKRLALVGHQSIRDLARLQLAGQLGELHIQLGRLLGRAGDDQRRPRLVDQDVVHLVHDRERVIGRLALLRLGPAAVLDLLLQRGGHVVPQVVKAEL